MPSQRMRRIGLAAIAAFVVGVAFLAVFWQTVARAAVVGGLAWTTGLHLSAAHLEVHRDRLVARGVHIENGAHEPIADIEYLTLRYSVRDFFPGSARMFGLVGFDVENAHLIVTRHRDGTLNIPLKQQVASGPSTTPYTFVGRLRNGRVDVYDFTQGSSPARHLLVSNIVADLDVATNARTRYRVGLDYVEDDRRYPLAGTGDVNVGSGVGLQRWQIARLPIARIVDVALDTPALRMTSGWLRDVDARVIGLPGAGGSLVQHASATANLERAQIALGGLAKPLRDVHGPIAAYGDGLLLQDVRATLARVPIRVGGGIFGLDSPRAKISVAGTGDAATLRAALAQTAKLPLTGAVHLNVAIEGAATKPLVLIALRSPRIAYGALPVDRTNGLVAFDGREADVLDLRTRYAGIGLFGYGRLLLHPQRNGFEMLAGLDAPAGALPYANALAPMPLHAAIVAAGDRFTRLDTRGVVFGEGGAKRVAGTFELSSSGIGTIGPLRVDAPNQSLYAIASVNRPRSKFDAMVQTRNLQLASNAVAALPGLTLPAQPPFAATVDSTVAGSLDRTRLSLSGFADLRGVRTPSARVAQAHVVFGRTARMPLTLAMDASGIGALGAVATALVSYENGTIRVNDAAAATRGTFADAHGSIADVQRGTPRYDLTANVHSVDVATLAALAAPRAAGLVEGSAEARLHVAGAGSSPSVSGMLAL
ncbi:MAG: hypothetical protein JOZ01_03960, partial [Candidatus Eremiobacteraeota bacterium]|nr:hypothetical protein [Candidatus Eremiobacteraeota bacterium]